MLLEDFIPSLLVLSALNRGECRAADTSFEARILNSTTEEIY